MRLVEIGGDVGSVLGALFRGDFAGAQKAMDKVFDKTTRSLFNAADDVGQAADAYWKTVTGEDTPAARQAGRAFGSPLAGAEGVPRTNGRGMGAGLVSGSGGFGQASAESVQAFTGGGAAKESKGKAGVVVHQSNQITTEVNAHTGASPKEIARHADKVVRERLIQQTRNLRDALVNKAP
jgi:hypothetical protein